MVKKAFIAFVAALVSFGSFGISNAFAVDEGLSEIIVSPLVIVSKCSEDPETFRTWEVQNNTANNVVFNWQVLNTDQSNSLTVLANGSVTFDTVTQDTNTLAIYIDGNLISSLVSSGAQCQSQEPPVCGTELVKNGSFESPVLTNSQGWDAFPSGANNIGWKAQWVNTSPEPGKPVVANLEYQNFLTAQDGSQFTELDSDWDGIPSPHLDDASVKIYQYLFTNPGKKYEISFHTSPLPHTDVTQNRVEFSWDNSVQDLIVEDGTSNNDTQWSNHSYVKNATSNVTKIQFKDDGVSNTFGSLLDNVSVKEKCGYSISGKVYEDLDESNSNNSGDNPLNGWTVKLDNVATETDENTTTTSDSNGNYIFENLDAGCYIVAEVLPSGWAQTEPAVDTHTYQVAVGGVDNCDAFNSESSIIGFFAKTAHAAAVQQQLAFAGNASGINFGNFDIPSGNGGGSGGNGGNGGGSGGSGGGGTPPADPGTPTNTGRVLGDSTNIPTGSISTPIPRVLGAETTLPRTGLPLNIIIWFVSTLAATYCVYSLISKKLSNK